MRICTRDRIGCKKDRLKANDETTVWCNKKMRSGVRKETEME